MEGSEYNEGYKDAPLPHVPGVQGDAAAAREKGAEHRRMPEVREAGEGAGVDMRVYFFHNFHSFSFRL